MVRVSRPTRPAMWFPIPTLSPSATLHDVLELKARTGHSTIAITDDGTASGRLMGIVASRDYRINHTPDDAPVTDFMTPMSKLVTAPENTSLHDCNNIIWDNKINTLPLVDEEGHLKYFVFRKDYNSHKENAQRACWTPARAMWWAPHQHPRLCPAGACSGGSRRGCAVHRLPPRATRSGRAAPWAGSASTMATR